MKLVICNWPADAAFKLPHRSLIITTLAGQPEQEQMEKDTELALPLWGGQQIWCKVSYVAQQDTK